jgi:hypothetical protein
VLKYITQLLPFIVLQKEPMTQEEIEELCLELNKIGVSQQMPGSTPPGMQRKLFSIQRSNSSSPALSAASA